MSTQLGLLDRRRLVGLRAGRAQPRRRRPLVERQAPEHLRGPAGGGGNPWPRPRDPHRGRAAHRGRDAAAAPGERTPARVTWQGRTRGGRPSPRRWPAGVGRFRRGYRQIDPPRTPAGRRGRARSPAVTVLAALGYFTILVFNGYA